MLQFVDMYIYRSWLEKSSVTGPDQGRV